MKQILALSICVLLSGCARALPPQETVAQAIDRGSIIDLTHAYDSTTLFWPTADPFTLEVVADGMTAGGYYYAANVFTTAEHGGTHLDAPVHFAKGRHTADAVPLDRLIAPAVVIDVRDQATQDADYQVTVQDVESWEAVHGRVPDNAMLLIRTGFSNRWPDAAQYLGTAERGAGAVPLLHFPGLHPTLARWLVDNRRVAAVGIDTASIDYGQSTLFESHRALYEANIPGLENLAALDLLPETGATVIALPMKIAGGSGAPLRAVAIVP